MKKWRKLKSSWKVQCNEITRRCITDILQWIIFWIIVAIMSGCFLFGPYFVIAIMRDNVNAGITHPDIDVQEQIQAEMDDSIGG